MKYVSHIPSTGGICRQVRCIIIENDGLSAYFIYVLKLDLDQA